MGLRNRVEINGELTIVYANHKGEEYPFLIDTEDFNLLRNNRETWFLNFENTMDSFYVRCTRLDANGGRKTIQLQREIMKASGRQVVDHINHNTLDNRKCNLRIATKSENQQNRDGATRKSKSGIRGVSWKSSCKKWVAQIGINKKVIHVGIFTNIEDAEKAVIEARKKHMTYSA